MRAVDKIGNHDIFMLLSCLTGYNLPQGRAQVLEQVKDCYLFFKCIDILTFVNKKFCQSITLVKRHMPRNVYGALLQGKDEQTEAIIKKHEEQQHAIEERDRAIEERDRAYNVLGEVAHHAVQSEMDAIVDSGKKAKNFLQARSDAFFHAPTECLVVLREVNIVETGGRWVYDHRKAQQDAPHPFAGFRHEMSARVEISNYGLPITFPVRVTPVDICRAINHRRRFQILRPLKPEHIMMSNVEGTMFKVPESCIFQAHGDPDYDQNEIPNVLVPVGVVNPNMFKQRVTGLRELLAGYFMATDDITKFLVSHNASRLGLYEDDYWHSLIPQEENDGRPITPDVWFDSPRHDDDESMCSTSSTSSSSSSSSD